MAKKSEIRAAAKAGLDALLAAAAEKDDARAGEQLQTAMSKLSEAAGIAPAGKRLSEAGSKPAAGEVGLLERLGIHEDGSQLDDGELQALRERNIRETSECGLLDTMLGSDEAEIFRDIFRELS